MMDADEQRRYGAYLRCLADLLGLRDWTVALDVSSDAGPYGATVERVYGRKIARVAVCPEFAAMPAGEQRQTLVHELVHCHLGGAQDAARVLGGVLSSEAYGAWWPLFDHQIEFAVDALADAIAPTLPLPDEVMPDGAADGRQEGPMA